MVKIFQTNSVILMTLFVNNKRLMAKSSCTTHNLVISDRITQLSANVQTMQFSNLIQEEQILLLLITCGTQLAQIVRFKLLHISLNHLKDNQVGLEDVVLSYAQALTIMLFTIIQVISWVKKDYYQQITAGLETTSHNVQKYHL